MKKPFTIVVFTENKIGLLNRVTSLFTQRHINIESLTVSESEFQGIHRFTIVIQEVAEKVEKIVKQIEKQVEVLKSYSFADEDTVFSEIAIYKINVTTVSETEKLQEVIEKNQLKELAREGDFLFIEKTGTKEETNQVFDELKAFGLLGFVRSGRVSLSKSIGSFSGHLEQFELHSKEIITKYN
ncbi:MAG: acetolactate synthase small subunit [Bacteroidota bacterium]